MNAAVPSSTVWRHGARLSQAAIHRDKTEAMSRRSAGTDKQTVSRRFSHVTTRPRTPLLDTTAFIAYVQRRTGSGNQDRVNADELAAAIRAGVVVPVLVKGQYRFRGVWASSGLRITNTDRFKAVEACSTNEWPAVLITSRNTAG